MNDNAPESERWVPVPDTEPRQKLPTLPSSALERARREAEAVIEKAFTPKP